MKEIAESADGGSGEIVVTSQMGNVDTRVEVDAFGRFYRILAGDKPATLYVDGDEGCGAELQVPTFDGSPGMRELNMSETCLSAETLSASRSASKRPQSSSSSASSSQLLSRSQSILHSSSASQSSSHSQSQISASKGASQSHSQVSRSLSVRTASNDETEVRKHSAGRRVVDECFTAIHPRQESTFTPINSHTPAASPSSPSSSPSSSHEAAWGITAGVLAALALIIIGVVFWRQRKYTKYFKPVDDIELRNWEKKNKKRRKVDENNPSDDPLSALDNDGDDDDDDDDDIILTSNSL